MVEQFTSDRFKNCHINFTKTGVEMVITLNIEKDMVPYLNPNRVFFKNKFNVYVLKSLIEEVNIRSIEGCYNWLMRRAMIDCREAKKKVIDEQIRKISGYEKVPVQLTIFTDK